MSDRENVSRELRKWKEKYFDQVGEAEKKEKSLNEHVSLLQRILVRVSLAAEGQNPRLDNELGNLREILRRENPGQLELTKRLSDIESAVLELDHQRAEHSTQVVGALQNLIDQLTGFDLERGQKRRLKSLAKMLKGQQLNLKEYPNLLHQYAEIQESALREQLMQMGDASRPGLLNRLFGRSGSSGATQTNGQSTGDVASKASDIEDTAGSDDTELDITLSDENGEPVPGFSTIAGHVCGALNNLIEQLTLPENATKEAERLQENISRGLNWYELGPTLDDVANLVISAVGRGQHEFEAFLQGLDERLAKLQSFLSDSRRHTDDWRSNSGELDRMVRSQVSSISDEIANATDMNRLKLSINSHLDAIVSTMDEYRVSEERREGELNQQLTALQERLCSMEQETGAIRERLREERSRALTDVLTQLPNREAFDERYELEYERWLRYRQPATLVVGDIDFFKRVNDQYGHLAGDKVIQIIAKEIKLRTRKTDFVARYGGEEFVILLPETPLEMAQSVMDKTREMISRLPFHFRNERVQITMSFGMVAFAEGMNKESLFDLADQALYRAKGDGRNQVAVA
ncbi:MAG: GGDEF domain-containing protein [Hahellaceae bacterium]|nr:GGDEF domain-containing protein [Hahellaceae bacterium]MCP5168347.1 GGDEF domain-containing protein [Hahellaceae bacterium]